MDNNLSMEFGKALYRLMRVKHKVTDPELSDLPFSHREVIIVCGINDMNNGDLVQMNQVADSFGLSRAAVSQIINKLEKRNIINRVKKEGDHRSVYLKVNDEVIKKINEHMKKQEQDTAYVLNQLGDKDAKELIRIMNRIGDLLDKEDVHV